MCNKAKDTKVDDYLATLILSYKAKISICFSPTLPDR